MGCALACHHRQISLRREERVVPTTDIETWANPGSYVRPVDLSAFISASSVPLLPPLEDPPPYTEQLLEGHISLTSEAKAYMMGAENPFPATADDDSMTDRSSTSIECVTIADEGLLNDIIPAHSLNDQHIYCASMNSEYRPIALQLHHPASAQHISSPPTAPPKPGFTPCTMEHNHGLGCPTYALSSSIQFHRHHRSLSENCTIYDQSQGLDSIPSTAHSTAKLPTAIASPLHPRTFLPFAHISQGQNNIAQELRGERMANDHFVRRPSRLPPLQRPSQPQREKGEQRLSHSWHEGSNFLHVSPLITLHH